MIAGNATAVSLAVVDNDTIPQRIKVIQLAQVCRQFGGCPKYLIKVCPIPQTVLTNLERDMAVVGAAVSSAPGVPAAPIPGQCLIDRHGSVSRLTDKGMDTDIQPRPVPVVGIGVFPETSVVGLHVAPEPGIVCPCGMYHDPLGGDGHSALVAVAVGKNTLFQDHFIGSFRSCCVPK